MEQTPKINFSILATIQKICIALDQSQLNAEATEKIKVDSLNLANYLDVSEEQAWFFSIIYIQQYMGLSCDLSDIMRELDMQSSKLVKYRQDLVTLINKKLIKTEYEKRKGKAIPCFKFMRLYDYVSDAIYHNISLADELKNDTMDIYDFCKEVSDLIEERSKKDITTDQLIEETRLLEIHSSQLEVIKKPIDMGISIYDRILFYEMFDDMVRGRGDTSLERTMRDIYDSQSMKINRIREITENTSKLIQRNLITVVSGSFISDVGLVPTNEAIELMLGQDAELFIKKQTLKDLIPADSIAIKQLYFEEKLQKQIDFFQTSLTHEKFSAMQSRLQEMAMPKGVAAVFYGAPGTGKTESVYQIAKSTGRDVLYVDISQTKSMWFGESEKRIKAVFNDYARLCRKNLDKPILLFNEADAVLGKRKDNNASNVAQTENAIQNIILEQMEKNEGIIIATTNLVDNLDTAFERRFLFKLKFEMPTLEAKKHIWKSKLNWLNDENAAMLASRFQFTGGEIDNIARKAIINEVISGNRASIDEVIEYCETERLRSKNGRKLGYN